MLSVTSTASAWGACTGRNTSVEALLGLGSLVIWEFAICEIAMSDKVKGDQVN